MIDKIHNYIIWDHFVMPLFTNLKKSQTHWWIHSSWQNKCSCIPYYNTHGIPVLDLFLMLQIKDICIFMCIGRSKSRTTCTKIQISLIYNIWKKIRRLGCHANYSKVPIKLTFVRNITWSRLIFSKICKCPPHISTSYFIFKFIRKKIVCVIFTLYLS